MGLLPNNIKPDKYLGKGIEYLGFTVLLVLIILGISFYAIITKSLNLGDLGSYLSGALGSIIALLVAIFTFLAFYVQYDANKKIQEQFKIQQFESQFYKMLDIHIKNLESFRIRNFNINPITGAVTRGETRGRRIFLPMVKEFHYLLDVVHSFYNEDTSGRNEQINKIAYEIFFFGLKSNHLKGQSENDVIHAHLIWHLTEFQNGFRNTQSIQRTIRLSDKFKSKVEERDLEIKIRYIPFSGHESRLAHYFRHLYQTVKQVDEARKERIITYPDARRYLASLRAQLSNEEQQLLYYNYLCGAGKSWDRLGGKHLFLTDYRMIHNIPLDDNRISPYIENPRDHFKKYICDKCTDEDPLFEWDDNRERLGCN